MKGPEERMRSMGIQFRLDQVERLDRLPRGTISDFVRRAVDERFERLEEEARTAACPCPPDEPHSCGKEAS